LDISGKVVLITGASRGIGAACAEAFGRRSAQLALTARTSFERSGALIVPGDVTDPAARERVVHATLERFGRIDILINNAGQGGYHSALTEGDEVTRALFELNYFAPLGMMRLVVPAMKKQGAGMIVNVSSIAGQIAIPWLTTYSATKFALKALTDALRIELTPAGIGMMTVCPGYVDTPFHDHALGPPPASIAGAKPFAISARRCAEDIARGVERDARTVVTPSLGWALVWLQRFLPSIVDSRLRTISQ
jgi:short-subunit dehydrogenase